jgi:hypothetical protein
LLEIVESLTESVFAISYTIANSPPTPARFIRQGHRAFSTDEVTAFLHSPLGGMFDAPLSGKFISAKNITEYAIQQCIKFNNCPYIYPIIY